MDIRIALERNVYIVSWIIYFIKVDESIEERIIKMVTPNIATKNVIKALCLRYHVALANYQALTDTKNKDHFDRLSELLETTNQPLSKFYERILGVTVIDFIRNEALFINPGLASASSFDWRMRKVFSQPCIYLGNLIKGI
jgi:hypothetical protein